MTKPPYSTATLRRSRRRRAGYIGRAPLPAEWTAPPTAREMTLNWRTVSRPPPAAASEPAADVAAAEGTSNGPATCAVPPALAAWGIAARGGGHGPLAAAGASVIPAEASHHHHHHQRHPPSSPRAPHDEEPALPTAEVWAHFAANAALIARAHGLAPGPDGAAAALRRFLEAPAQRAALDAVALQLVPQTYCYADYSGAVSWCVSQAPSPPPFPPSPLFPTTLPS